MKRIFTAVLSALLTVAMLPVSAFAASVTAVVPMKEEDMKIIRGYSADGAFSVEDNAVRVNGKSGAVSTARYIDVTNSGGIVFTVTYLDDYSGISAESRGNYHFGIGLMDEQCFMGNPNDLCRGIGVDFCFTESHENAGYRLKTYTYDGYASLSNSFTGINRTYATGIEATKSFRLKFEKINADTWKLWDLDNSLEIATFTSKHFGEGLFADGKAYLVFGCYGAVPMNMSVTVNQVYGFSWGKCFNAVRYGESIALESNILTNFYVGYNEDALDIDGEVSLTLSTRDGLSFNDITKTYASVKDGEFHKDKNAYCYSIAVPAARGADKITVRIAGNDGRVFSWSTSVYGYLNGVEAISPSTELSELSSAIKSYCSAAERYFELVTPYTSSFEQCYYTYSSLSNAREDQMLIQALIDRMDNSAAVYVGSSTVLYKGFRQKLDTSDYSRVTKAVGGDILIPAEFAERYFGRTLVTDSDDYVNITDFCRSTLGYRLYYDTASGLAVILPPHVAAFTGNGVTDGYTDTQYRERMIAFFTSDLEELPEPRNNSEQSRTVIVETEYTRDGDYTTKNYTACSSPTLTSVKENGVNVLYAAYELSTVNDVGLQELGTVTVVVKSSDGGATWSEVGRIQGLRWSTAEAVNGTVYLFGNHISTGDAMIARISGGKISTACVASGVGGGGPTAVAVTSERVYKAYNQRAISAPIDADLLDKNSWTVSNSAEELINVDYMNAATGKSLQTCQISECNLVVGTNGVIYAVMRIEGESRDSVTGYVTGRLGKGYAAILRLSNDGTTYSYCGNGIIEDFPTGISKFMIKYDAATGKYICLSNLSFGNAPNPNERTVLAISSSTDLRNWTVHDYLAVEREMINADAAGFAHGWQYPDFVIDGDSLYYIIRESSGESGGWHNANHVSFYTLADYKSVIGS